MKYAINVFFETDGWVCAGTPILTARGECLAETLTEGELLVTIRADGPPLLPLARITQRRVQLGCHPAPAAARPICIRAHAFAPAMPAHDLWLSPNQLIYIDGGLFALSDLCNGTSIHPSQGMGRVTYVRLALSAHDVILADGLPLASAAPGDRVCVPLHLHFAAPAGDDLCLPVTREGPSLAEARAMLAYRASIPLHRPSAARPRTGSGPFSAPRDDGASGL